MAVGYESAQINSQLLPVAPGQSFAPLTFGAQYTGPGYWPRNGVYNVPPVTPAPGSTGNGGMETGTYGQTLPTAGAMGSNGPNYLHPTKSPAIWGIAFLIFALFMLHKVHFRE